MRLTLGEEFVAALVHSGDISQYSKFSQVRTFLKPIELEAFEAIANHVTKHGVLPKPNTLETEAGIEVECPDEPPSYYFDKLKQRYIRLSLIQGVQEANDTLKEDPEKTLEFFRDLCSKLTLDSTLNQVVDLRNAEDYVWPMYTQRRTKKGNLIMTGWSRFDEMTGGVSGGDVVSFVGRPSQGKSQMLVWASLNTWDQQKLPVMLVSMEMSVEQIIERSVAVYSHVPLAELRCQRGRRVPTSRQKRLKEELAELRTGGVPFYIIDGNLGKTVPDIQILARQLQPSAIYIDGGYLLEHPDGKLQANHRIAANSRMLKMELSSALKIPVFCTWQINREGSKSKLSKGQKMGMEHVAGSDAISQDSSIICGLMEEENPSNMHHRNVQILKGRHGEDGEFQMAWDWERMRFGDPPEEEPVAYVEGREVRKKTKVKSGAGSDDE